ncbi:related to Hexokinase-1 [Ramularia collo-cygni]|uniref:Phosphotransferase n=1 Tax=Ramularia collo-cygni TaxID=112498 RepID=A0A2D3UPI5_9PEZI|nr:related to Hexokinase-1 [Ramularia collo-cygni]CZT15838.1 related to Hexokinase-1 [Ramularia collo-cygni]
MSVMIQSAIRVVQPSHNTKRPRVQHVAERKSMDDFTYDVRCLFEAPLETERLLAISLQLQEECRERLRKSDISMLPSYQHTLPTGNECGDFLALDVGGSTFRIALIRLTGKSKPGGDGLQIRRIRSFHIDEQIRGLQGQAFFDWMADRMGDMLGQYRYMCGAPEKPLLMGLTWSFPLEQTSPRSGKLLAMGKGFKATWGVDGEDLSELIMRSCTRKGLNVEMRAIVNDGAATLMSQAYRDPSTRMSLILGTGTNAGVFLPVKALHPAKFGERPDSWYAEAHRVLINTELSMVGKDVLPTTRWDDMLNADHPLPDFQPLEYLITGRYLGEIVRLILLDATETIDLFNGQIPEGLDQPYSFDSRIIAAFESDTTPTLDTAKATFIQAHPSRSTIRLCELEFIRDVAGLVSRRAAAYLATALHALWVIRTEAEHLEPGEATHVTVACNGTVIEKYPRYKELCQQHLDDMCERSGASRGAVTLKMAPESSIFGAAVAVACMEDGL